MAKLRELLSSIAFATAMTIVVAAIQLSNFWRDSRAAVQPWQASLFFGLIAGVLALLTGVLLIPPKLLVFVLFVALLLAIPCRVLFSRSAQASKLVTLALAFAGHLLFHSAGWLLNHHTDNRHLDCTIVWLAAVLTLSTLRSEPKL